MEKAEMKEAPLSLFRGLKEIMQYWKWFLISVVVCLFLSVLYVYMTQPVYQVDANVLIKNESDKGGGAGMAMSSMLQGFSFGSSLTMGGGSVDDELLLINSYTLIRKSVADLNLNTIYTSGSFFSKKDYFGDSPFLIMPKDSLLPETFSSALVFKLNVERDGTVKVKAKEGWSSVGEVSGKTFPLTLSVEDYGDFLITKTPYFEKNPVESMKIVFLGYNLTTESIMKNLVVSIKEKKANGINLTVEETNINRGKALLNTIIRKYNEEGLQDKNTSALRSVDFFDQRIALNERELEQIEKRLEAFKKDNNLT
ncbi:Wzz/FepE/Etk N-terminal domain-containing protein, partial [Parabacteroides faecis]